MKARSRSKKRSAYSVLIICEGQNTEPSYFSEFERYLNENFKSLYPNGIEFSIFPYDTEENGVEQQSQFLVRKVGNRKVSNFESIISDDVEKEYWSAPERWVRFAQKKAIMSGFNEVWSVFDYDNRPDANISRAFELAKEPIDEDGKIVKIAYSSYSFEYWLLLHYELYLDYLPYSECKDINRKIINCAGKIVDATRDCGGKKCLGGYLRVKGYEVGFYNKSSKSTFPAIENQISKARFHANLVRSLPENTKKSIWSIKPITTVYELIDSLTKYPFSVKWSFESKTIRTTDFTLKWLLNKKRQVLNICISPKSKRTILLSTGDVKLFSIDFDEHQLIDRIVVKEDKEYNFREIDLANLPIIARYISIQFRNVIYINSL